jgi:hypothetical protein
MNELLQGLPAPDSEKTLLLGQVFNNTAASYKFFWLLGLLTLLQHHKKGIFSQREIVEEMIIAAWHSVCFYRLSFGVQDNLQHAVMDFRKESALDNDAQADEIRAKLKGSKAIDWQMRELTNLVPTRFLTPWFAHELRGLADHVKTRKIHELSRQSQASANPCPYFFEQVSNELLIHVNESWAAFFRENFEVIRSFIFFHLCRYLQARNPNVPGIVNKLSAPIDRDLGPARKYWRAVRSEFNEMGKGHLFHDIYSGAPLPDSFSIDHFLPWSFVAHDLLWNLAPVLKVTNSKKSDSLPKAEIYLPRLSKLHHESLLLMRDKTRMLEDYANWFQADINRITTMPEDEFFHHYRGSIEPQLQIAHNQGFQANWVWSEY